MSQRRNWTDEEVCLLTNEYGKSNRQELALRLGRSPIQVTKKAFKLGLKASSRWTEDDNLKLASVFEDADRTTISEMFPDRTWASILQHGIKELGLNRHNQCGIKHDHTAFSEWNEYSAYFAGFIAADGYLMLDKGVDNVCCLQIELAEYDRDVLDKLALYLNAPADIVKVSNRETVKIQFSSRKIVKDLHNVFQLPVEDKTDTLRWPTSIPDDMVRHYVRGYFDGDGSVYTETLKAGIRLRAQVLGNEEFITDLKSSIPIPLDSISVRKRGEINVWVFTMSKDSEEFLTWIYKDSCVFLDRKYNSAVSYIPGLK